MLTAYDYATARLVDEAGVPLILVGDSLGMVVLGYDSTIPVTIEEMLHHTKAVVKGTERALVVGDMPFMTYHANVSDAIYNAGRFLQEAGCQAVKLEGGESMAEVVHRVVQCGIPVMGHIGLTPQSIHQLGGFKVQGKTPEAAIRQIKDAQALVDILDCQPGVISFVEGDLNSSETVYQTPFAEFEVSRWRVEPGEERNATRSGPRVLIVTQGDVLIRWGDDLEGGEEMLRQGQSVFVPALLEEFKMKASSFVELFVVKTPYT